MKEDPAFWYGKIVERCPHWSVERALGSVTLSLWLPECEQGPNLEFTAGTLGEAVQKFIDSLPPWGLAWLRGDVEWPAATTPAATVSRAR